MQHLCGEVTGTFSSNQVTCPRNIKLISNSKPDFKQLKRNVWPILNFKNQSFRVPVKCERTVLEGQAQILFASCNFSGLEEQQINQNFVKQNMTLTQNSFEKENIYSPAPSQHYVGGSSDMSSTASTSKNQSKCASGENLNKSKGEIEIQSNNKSIEAELHSNCINLLIHQMNDTEDYTTEENIRIMRQKVKRNLSSVMRKKEQTNISGLVSDRLNTYSILPEEPGTIFDLAHLQIKQAHNLKIMLEKYSNAFAVDKQ